MASGKEKCERQTGQIFRRLVFCHPYDFFRGPTHWSCLCMFLKKRSQFFTDTARRIFCHLSPFVGHAPLILALLLDLKDISSF